MKKYYILDTNVLLSSANSLLSFEDNIVLIPDIVLEELDNHKDDKNEAGYNARCVSRILKNLRKKGDLLIGVDNGNGGEIRFLPNNLKNCDDILSHSFTLKKADNIIIAMTKIFADDNPDKSVILVSRDTNVILKAESVGLKAEEYTTDNIQNIDTLYTGRRNHVFTTSECINDIYKNKALSFLAFEDPEDEFTSNPPKENEYFCFVSITDNSQTVLVRYREQKFELLDYNYQPFNIRPLNTGQYFAMDALKRPVNEIPLVILNGPSGTAKTFLSLAVGIYNTQKNEYSKVLLSRANVKFDEDIGYLKGTEEEKIAPLLRFAKDNLEHIFPDSMNILEELTDEGIITGEAMAYMRGRSICDTFVLIDEVQNLTPDQIKGVITRAGEGTKIVLCGDPAQIDNKWLSYNNNGLVYAIDKMGGKKECAVITFEDDEIKRSKLAEVAANCM